MMTVVAVVAAVVAAAVVVVMVVVEVLGLSVYAASMNHHRICFFSLRSLRFVYLTTTSSLVLLVHLTTTSSLVLQHLAVWNQRHHIQLFHRVAPTLNILFTTNA